MRRESASAASAEKSGAPGSSWTSKKFHEEFERMMTGVLDRDWDHSESSLILWLMKERNRREAYYWEYEANVFGIQGSTVMCY